MSADRLLALLSLLAQTDVATSTARLCTLAAEVTGTSGAALMLVDGDVPWAAAGASGPVATLLEDLQQTLGEGPGIDAHTSGRPVTATDLVDASATRWPAFAQAALAGGVRALFAFPVRLGAVRLGALDLHRNRAGPLSDDAHADALVLASLAARTLLALQADCDTDAFADGVEFPMVVYQAAGMASEQLGVSVADAQVRLRARAFADGRLVADLARDIVERRLRLTELLS